MVCLRVAASPVAYGRRTIVRRAAGLIQGDLLLATPAYRTRNEYNGILRLSKTSYDECMNGSVMNGSVWPRIVLACDSSEGGIVLTVRLGPPPCCRITISGHEQDIP
eukprot:COSAG02_NODE_143_length_34133_cov_272.981282_21_plen_107_part_00